MLTWAQLKKLCRKQPQVGIKLLAVLCLTFSQTMTTKSKCSVSLSNFLRAELKAGAGASLELRETLEH